jgi:hypothetical protein
MASNENKGPTSDLADKLRSIFGIGSHRKNKTASLMIMSSDCSASSRGCWQTAR